MRWEAEVELVGCERCDRPCSSGENGVSMGMRDVPQGTALERWPVPGWMCENLYQFFIRHVCPYMQNSATSSI